MSTEVLATREEGAEAIVPIRALIQHAPEVVIAEAHKAAAALQDVLSKKPRKVVMNGEQYLEFEDWQLLGRFYGITAKEDGDAEYVEMGPAAGFKASAIAVNAAGEILSRATAYCLNDEEKWSSRAKYAWLYATKSGAWSETDPGPEEIVWIPNPNKPGKNMPKRERQQVGEETVPLFQLSSMAQTRASAKVLRNVLAWVVVLAGYRPTPAEEIEDLPRATTSQAPSPREPGADDVEDAEVIKSSVGPVRPGSGERAAAAGAEPNPEYDANAKRAPRATSRRSDAPAANGQTVACPHCGKPARPSKFPKPGQSHYCYDCKHPFSPENGR